MGNLRKRVFAAIICMTLGLALNACASNTSEEKGSESQAATDTLTVDGEKIEGTVEEIPVEQVSTRDIDFINKLVSFGFTEDEAKENAEILLTCGIPTIDICEPTDSKATIDGLVSFRGELDEDRTFWFTVENRKIFYVSLNGEDLYDEDKGGYLQNFEDVHIPETSISFETQLQLRDMTEELLDKYYGPNTSKYYDAWGIGRKDNVYGAQCQVLNSLLADNWSYAYVLYELGDDGEFTPTSVKIDGVQYEVKN